MPDKNFAIFEKYCLDCLDSLNEKGEVNFEELSFNLIEDIRKAETWHHVLNSGDIPPRSPERG